MRDLKLWYDTPALGDWNKAMPIGNGRLGAMVFGNTDKELLQLNEESIWYGKPVDRNNPNAAKSLAQARELILKGEVSKAERVLKYNFSGVPQSERPYQTLGDMRLDFYNHKSQITDYRRELDLENAVAKATYKCGDILYERIAFCSAADDVIALYITADKPESVSFDALLTRGRFYDENIMPSSDTIAIAGNCGEGGIKFCAAAKAVVFGAKATAGTAGGFAIIENADAALILIAAYTTFRHNDYIEKTINKLNQVAVKPFEKILDAHISDYKKYFDRVKLTIDDNERELHLIPTDKRLERLKQGKADNGLIALYFQFGRYLMLSCSRKGTLPSNLQGIWNNEMSPRWDSKYTININTQMNYWPAEVCNLPECHMPLFEHLERMLANGEKTAQAMYGCRGFVAHHNTDIWADTAPQDIYMPATYWPMGAAWLSLHIWEHYLFTKDLSFLKSKIHILNKAAQFFIDFLIENKDGQLITCPSVSPENSYFINGEKVNVCCGPSMDNQILRELFNACIQAADILNENSETADTLKTMLAKLPPIKTGKHGQIMEWLNDYDEPEPGHRHISHLFALYPAWQISPLTTPDLADAAIVTLNRRLQNGGGYTGWSRAWIINMWARLFKADKAYESLILLLTNSTHPNLFCNHPPFQIDGNFGGTAAIAEMLVQSHSDILHLLPSLPQQWQTGRAAGLRIRGNAEIELEWNNGSLNYCKITAFSSINTRALYKGRFASVNMAAGEIKILTAENFN